jgi:hypothetical protein
MVRVEFGTAVASFVCLRAIELNAKKGGVIRVGQAVEAVFKGALPIGITVLSKEAVEASRPVAEKHLDVVHSQVPIWKLGLAA